MILRKCFTLRTCAWRKYLLNENIGNIYLYNQLRSYRGRVCYKSSFSYQHDLRFPQRTDYNLLSIQRYYCKGIDGDALDLQKAQHEKELKKLTEIFPQPRVTLNELQTKTPDKAFEIHFKQNVVTPKGKKKKIVQSNDWHCTYVFTWPEKIKFESTAISKRQAQEKAAIQALYWLYVNKRIDAKGTPMYDRNVLKELKSTLNEPIQVTISDSSVERIDKIWNEYESGIKDIYEKTFKESRQRSLVNTSVLTKDSTIDEDDFSENDAEAMDNVIDILETKSNIHPVYGRHITPPTKASLKKREATLKRIFEHYDEELTPLPIDEFTDKITSTLENNRVLVIVGAAGCGKSTRAPVAVLRHWRASSAALVAQPRRVAAIGLAERVASEMGEEVGESVGYQVRLHSKPPRPPGGSILYCTSGVLLRRLQVNPGLEGCSHVFIDEAHERDVNTDVTLLLLKRALHVNVDLKVVIMSATLDVDVFTKYFDTCPIIEVPGRAFPVDIMYLEDVQKKFKINLPNTLQNCDKERRKPQINCQEIAEVIKAVDSKEKEGAILVFLPGWSEIKQTKELLETHYGESSLHLILPVHSKLSTSDQTKMFAKSPLGVRKIVLATNVAETSITIPDVVYVIDSGAHKENRIVENTGTASLETVWVSQAGAKQRTGRAGRVQPGHCYRLYTREKETEFAEHTTPEILRIPLEQTVLDCKTYAPDDKVEDFLSQLPEPPTRQAVRIAVNDLVDLGALTPSEQLTRLGTLLSNLTLHPRLGCSMIHSVILGNVVSIANVVTHCGDNIELFRNAPDRREEVRSIKRKYSATSDHSALHWLQDEFEQKVEELGWTGVEPWCDRYGIRKDRLGFVRSLSNLYLQQILKSSMIEPSIDAQELNRFADIDELTSAVLLSGVNALFTTRRHVRTKGKLATVTELFTGAGDRVHIASDSVNHGITKGTNKTHILVYFGGHHSSERRALLVYKSSLVTPHAALLFSPGNIESCTEMGTDGEDSSILIPKHKLRIYLPTSHAEKVLKAREMLWNTFRYYIERDVQKLSYEDNNTVSKFKVRLVKSIGRVLVEAHRQYVEGKTKVDYEDVS